MTAARSPRDRPLHPGDVVELRSPEEILATLDADGSLDAMPFMPELLKYAGRQMTVSVRVEKICDTISSTGSRRMRDTVYLDDLRCDGSSHDGCQAGCRIYWKEAWLRRVDDPSLPSNANGRSPVSADALAELERLATRGTRTVRDLDGEPETVWRCQATEAVKATTPLKTSDVRQYWRELKSGNHSLPRFAVVAIRGFFMELANRLGLLKALPLYGHGTRLVPSEPLDLQPGDRVTVRPPAEIEATLDSTGHVRGLSFDREMLPYCGKTFRVKDRVRRLVDDKTGRMINIRTDALILDGVVCSGQRSTCQWYCPRAIYPYWRETWLQRVDEEPHQSASARPVTATSDGKAP